MKPYTGPPLTLGDAAGANVRLIISCRSCGRRAEPDPAGQAAAHGADLPVPEWMARLCCSACGGREVDAVVSGGRR